MYRETYRVTIEESFERELIHAGRKRAGQGQGSGEVEQAHGRRWLNPRVRSRLAAIGDLATVLTMALTIILVFAPVALVQPTVDLLLTMTNRTVPAVTVWILNWKNASGGKL